MKVQKDIQAINIIFAHNGVIVSFEGDVWKDKEILFTDFDKLVEFLRENIEKEPSKRENSMGSWEGEKTLADRLMEAVKKANKIVDQWEREEPDSLATIKYG